jgi:hypothetical protein
METDWYLYFLKYVLRKKEDLPNSIYGDAGGIVHDLMEGFYKGEYKKEELEEIYDEKMQILELTGKKFDRNNEEQNIKTSEKYNYCNKHFLRNFKPIVGDNICLEKFCLIKVSKLLFQGYSDFEHEEIIDDKKKIIITDFKTSTIYKGEKFEKEKGQLLLYALNKIQEGWDVEDIIIRWLFTKYVSVTVPHKDTTRIRQIERNSIGESLKASINSQLKKINLYSESEIEEYINEMINQSSIDVLPENIKELLEIDCIDCVDCDKKGNIKKAFINKITKLLSNFPKYNNFQIESMVSEMLILNSIENMPKEIKDMFVIDDCYVEIPFTKEDIKELQIKIINKIVEAIKKEKHYRKTDDDSVFFQEITKENSYFLSVLSGYSANLHKPYKAYLEELKQRKSENENSENELDEDDLSWLEEIEI